MHMETAALAWPEVLQAARQHAHAGQPLSGITDDSRTTRPGAIFVAHAGHSTDGHLHTAEAVAAGARLVVAERPVACPVPLCVVPDGRRALSALASAWFGDPARAMRMAAVTGTNGKTTVVHLGAAILRAAGLRPCTVGTLGVQWDGAAPRRLTWTTPPPAPLHGALAEALRAGVQACVLEASAQGIAQARLADCPFEAAALTNLSREHREYFGDEAEYVQAKLQLFRELGARGRPARAVLHRGIPHAEAFRRACRVPVVEYGPGAEVDALHVRPLGLAGTRFRLRLPGARRGVRVHLGLPGLHNVDNALCAAALAVAMGVAPEAIAAGIAAVRHVPGRLQHIAVRPVRVLADYAHNPAGLRALLGLLRTATAGRLIVVMGARGGRDRGKRPLMGAVAAAFADRVLLTSDRPDGEDPSAAVEPMRAAIADCAVPVAVVTDRLEALALAVEASRPGDCVVAVGKGEEPWHGDSAAGALDDVAALQALVPDAGGGRVALLHPGGG